MSQNDKPIPARPWEDVAMPAEQAKAFIEALGKLHCNGDKSPLEKAEWAREMEDGF